MKKTTVLSFLLLVFVLLAFYLTQRAQGESNEGIVIKLSKNIYRITFNYYIPLNLVLYTGQDGILFVDTGVRDTSGKLESIVKKYGSANVRYIINTHLHDDHTGGNKVLGKTAVIMNFYNLAQRVKKGVISPNFLVLPLDPPSGTAAFFLA